MDISIILLIFTFICLLFTNTLKRFIIFSLALTLVLYLKFDFSFLVSIISSIIILKGFKDTLFNLNITITYLFKSRHKFKEKYLGKLVRLLFELNFTIFICICYIFLTLNISYLLEIDFQIIAIYFLGIYLIQAIKKATLNKPSSFKKFQF